MVDVVVDVDDGIARAALFSFSLLISPVSLSFLSLSIRKSLLLEFFHSYLRDTWISETLFQVVPIYKKKTLINRWVGPHLGLRKPVRTIGGNFKGQRGTNSKKISNSRDGVTLLDLPRERRTFRTESCKLCVNNFFILICYTSSLVLIYQDH